MKVFIAPHFQGADKGDGGIRRVVEAQHRWLPKFGWDIAANAEEADLVATHAGVQTVAPATKPVVSHCHGLYWYGFNWQKWALKMNRDVIKAMRRADVVTAPSEWVAHAIARGTNIKAEVIYHGIEPEDWSDPPASPLGHAYVLWNKTRIDPICDPRPMQRLAEMASDVQFISTIKWYESSAPPNVTVTGITNHDQAKDYVRNAGVYLATTRETFGIGTIEAMAAGVPILAWDWGGQKEIVRHLTDGYLARPDDYDDLLKGLRWCLANRARASAAARERALNYFTWERAIAHYVELYDRLVAARRAPHPKVSVVIPAYNMETMLNDAVDSVVAQNFQDYEIVIVDDASTDGTGELADALVAAVPNRLRVIHNSQNQYLAEALNTGIRQARGDYIVPLDADNMLGDGALATLASALDADRDIDIAYGAMSVIEEDGSRPEWKSDWPGEFSLRRQLKHQNQIPSTSMYRKRAWERVGGYRRRCRTAEDADFWCRATSFGANARRITDAVTLRYRNRSSSMSHRETDWAWHAWYPWGKRTELTPWIAPVDGEAGGDEPIIPMHEFSIVSVVIPVGPGHERLVLDALDSVRSQTFIWWEAIVVNDSGTDLRDIPPWARVVSTGGAEGAGAARNRGMAVASGQLFYFLDADDYLQPEALEVMVVEQHRAGGFVYSDWFRQETGEAHQAPEWDGCDSVLRQLPWPVNCLYPREVWDRIGGFDATLPAWEDWDFALRVVEAGYCGTRVAVPLFHYRMESGSRREAGFAARETLKQQILDKWEPYITGAKRMGCGCSGGGGLPSLPSFDLYAQTTPSFAAPVNGSAEAVLVEFVGDISAPITYTGQSTGVHYKFGSDADHRVRWVYAPDVEHFVEREEFRLYANVEASPALAAVGPPPR